MGKTIFIIIGLVLGGLIVREVAWWSSKEVITIEVSDKERITKGSNGDIESYYLVYTETETFENTDVLFLGKFNSSDIQGKLKPNHKYKVVVYGWRMPFFSSYRNIIEILE